MRLWWLLRPVLALPSQVYQVVAVAAGGVYMWVAALVARVMARDRTDAFVLVGGLCAVGNILLFFRYVESYAPVTALSLLVIWACWRYSEGRASFGTVGVLATLAPLFHGSALWWGPMVAAAWLVRSFQRPPERRWTASLADLRGLAVFPRRLGSVFGPAGERSQRDPGGEAEQRRDAHDREQVDRPESNRERVEVDVAPPLGLRCFDCGHGHRVPRV